jgi:hypothetical protein
VIDANSDRLVTVLALDPYCLDYCINRRPKAISDVRATEALIQVLEMAREHKPFQCQLSSADVQFRVLVTNPTKLDICWFIFTSKPQFRSVIENGGHMWNICSKFCLGEFI